MEGPLSPLDLGDEVNKGQPVCRELMVPRAGATTQREGCSFSLEQRAKLQRRRAREVSTARWAPAPPAPACSGGCDRSTGEPVNHGSQLVSAYDMPGAGLG